MRPRNPGAKARSRDSASLPPTFRAATAQLCRPRAITALEGRVRPAPHHPFQTSRDETPRAKAAGSLRDHSINPGARGSHRVGFGTGFACPALSFFWWSFSES